MRYSSTSETTVVPNVSKNFAVLSESNNGSFASMQRKKRSREAIAKRGALKMGWYGIGRPFNAIIPRTAAKAAKRIVNSNVIGMNDGQLASGFPATLIG